MVSEIPLMYGTVVIVTVVGLVFVELRSIGKRTSKLSERPENSHPL